MKKTTTILRYIVATLIILIGSMGLLEEFMSGYNPNSEDILRFSEPFRDLHNAIMMSYLGIAVRSLSVVCGALMLTKKYWYLGLLTFMPIAVNILAIHLLYDFPPAHLAFFSIGIFVSVSSIIIFIYEWKRFKTIVHQK